LNLIAVYFIVCEGQNTERWYFEHLNSFRRKQDIHSPIEIIPLKKEGKYKNLSYPAQLVRYANKQKSNPEIGFDPERDKMIIIFDADIFEHKVSGYDELISKAEEEQNIIGVTNSRNRQNEKNGSRRNLGAYFILYSSGNRVGIR
jgi:hypothetical protein